MNPVGARRAPGTRMPRLCALLLLCLANPLGLAAQTTTDRESVSKVIEGLFQLAGEQDGLARLPGSWSVVVAQFAKGDSRELRIPAKTGDHTESSVIPRPSAQTSTSASTTSKAPPVDCETYADDFPSCCSLQKQMESTGPSLTAASDERGGTSYAGMIVLRVCGDRRAGRQQVIRLICGTESEQRQGRVIQKGMQKPWS